MAENDIVADNVAYAIKRLETRGKTKSDIAQALNLDPSTLSRWLSKATSPTKPHVAKLAQYMGIDIELLHGSRKSLEEALDNLEDVNYANISRKISLRSVAKYRALWDETFQRYQGSYLFYSRLISGPHAHIAVSLLTVTSKAANGIVFSVHNIDDRAKDQHVPALHYVYEGLVFPVFDVLWFVGEEQSLDEIFSMVTSTSQKSPPTMIGGHFVATGVSPSTRMPAGTRVVLAFKGRRILSIDDVKESLGVLPEDKVPQSIRSQI